MRIFLNCFIECARLVHFPLLYSFTNSVKPQSILSTSRDKLSIYQLNANKTCPKVTEFRNWLSLPNWAIAAMALRSLKRSQENHGRCNSIFLFLIWRHILIKSVSSKKLVWLMTSFYQKSLFNRNDPLLIKVTSNLTILVNLIVHSHLWDTFQPTGIGDKKF